MIRVLSVLMIFVAVVAEAAPRYWAPASLRPGSVAEAYAWDEAPLAQFTVEVWRPGAKSPLASARSIASHTLSGPLARHWSAALVAPDALEAPGPVVIRFLGPGRSVLAELPSEVAARLFPIEEIPLNGSMSDLREKPDPRKDREAVAIWAVYQKFDPEFPWPKGPFRLPVPASFARSGQFGDIRLYKYTDGTTSRDYHRGIDFAVPRGTPVTAPALGTVALVADRALTGTTVVLEHAPGVYSVYFHLSAALVKPGQVVAPGDLIALSGASGLVTGPHLHWELRVGGVSVDPDDLVSGGLLDTATVDAVISSIEQKRG